MPAGGSWEIGSVVECLATVSRQMGWGGASWLLPHKASTIKGNAPLIRTNILSSCGSIDVSWPSTKQPSKQLTNGNLALRIVWKCFVQCSSSNGSGVIQKSAIRLSQVRFTCPLHTLSPSIQNFNKYIAGLYASFRRQILLIRLSSPARRTLARTQPVGKSHQERERERARLSLSKPQAGQLAISRVEFSASEGRRNEARGLCLSIHDCAGRAGEWVWGKGYALSVPETKCCGRVSNALVIRFRSTSWVNFSSNRACWLC